MELEDSESCNVVETLITLSYQNSLRSCEVMEAKNGVAYKERGKPRLKLFNMGQIASFHSSSMK